MTSAKQPPAPVGKGQLRCFQCRVPVAMKDGKWLSRDHKEVFVCKTCEREWAKAPANKR